MGIILGLGGLITLIALILRAQVEGQSSPQQKALSEGDAKPYATGLPERVKTTIMRGEEATKTELELAASSAAVAGYPKLGEALLEKAKSAPETAEQKGVPSPIPDVSRDAWSKFVKAMMTGKAGEVGPRGKVGLFQMSVRRLEDYGLMKNARMSGPKRMWTADWAVPQQRFLADHRLQYKLFEKSMQNYAKQILERYKPAVGTVFEGTRATLSGLLAVAHAAGIDGLGKWLKNDPPRAKFKATTEAYGRANGIF